MSQEHLVDHGHSVARWTGVIISFLGFLIGGIAIPFGSVPFIVLGGVLQVVALIAVVTLNAAGYGRPDVWAELKAKAAAERI